MFSPDDTIVAIATPPGRAGLGVVRLSGPRAESIVQTLLRRNAPLPAREATFTTLVDRSTGTRVTAIDQVVVTLFPRPQSYTGEHVVEVSAHGSPVLLERILKLACSAGARLAEPGEFTFRAFLNGRIDLVQAEAVADLIDAVTPLQARQAFDQLEGTITEHIGDVDRQLFHLIARLEASLDFPEEGYHFIDADELVVGIEQLGKQIWSLLSGATQGRLIREGCQVVIIGRPNVGKSSVFNYLIGSERAIVTEVAGTTRDLVTEVVDLNGLAVRLVDAAGIRLADDPVEAEGVSRARQALGVASAAMVVLDRSEPLAAEDRDVLNETTDTPRLVVLNKEDRPARWSPVEVPVGTAEILVEVSARTGKGMERLREQLGALLVGTTSLRDDPIVANTRHIDLLQRAVGALDAASDAARGGATEEFVLADLQVARAALEELTGKRTPDDVLQHIFERFCIGK